MFARRHLFQAALAAAALTGCGGNQAASSPGTEGYATVRVENDNFRDMRVYVRPGAGGARYRLGTANGMQATVLKIPRTMVTGITELTFEIVPMGGGGSQFSQKITVSGGEEIVLRISAAGF